MVTRFFNTKWLLFLVCLLLFNNCKVIKLTQQQQQQQQQEQEEQEERQQQQQQQQQQQATDNSSKLKGIYTIVPIFYATDRNIIPGQATAMFGTNWGGDQYSTGIVSVTVPKKHVIGNIEKTPWYRGEDKAKDFTIKSQQSLSQEKFYQALNGMCGKSSSRDVLIFIHGFNNTFEDAALRTAQVAYDLGFKGTTMMFSWPSNGSAVDYTQDGTNADWARPHLMSFLEDIASKVHPRNINIIAHSMGTRVLGQALREFKLAHINIHFTQVILAAPDIDAAIFKRDIVPCFTDASTHYTMYCSSNDVALKLSQKINGHPRAGDSGPGLVVAPPLETVDASGVLTDDFFNHTYFAKSDKLLRDIAALINNNATPAQRNLKMLNKTNLPYWKF